MASGCISYVRSKLNKVEQYGLAVAGRFALQSHTSLNTCYLRLGITVKSLVFSPSTCSIYSANMGSFSRSFAYRCVHSSDLFSSHPLTIVASDMRILANEKILVLFRDCLLYTSY
jgi:hypothetical protein